MIDVDDQKAQRPAGQRGVLHEFSAQMLEAAAIERAGQRVAPGARQQIFVTLAIGEEVEHVDDPRWALAPLGGKLDPAQIDRTERGVDRDRRHFRNPAAEQHRQRRPGEKAQAAVERDLVETQYQHAGGREPKEQAASEKGARAFVEQDHQNAIDEQDQRAPHHQGAHLVEKGKIGVAVRQHAFRAVAARDEGKREQQQIADQKAVDRLAHHHRVLADIDQQQQHQLAGEQHRRARRGDDAEGERHIDDAGQIGFEKMHHPERAEKGADADAVPGAKQAREYREIDQRVGDQQQRVNRGVGGERGGRRGRNLGHREPGMKIPIKSNVSAQESTPNEDRGTRWIAGPRGAGGRTTQLIADAADRSAWNAKSNSRANSRSAFTPRTLLCAEE
jgi:hypothetical protein